MVIQLNVRFVVKYGGSYNIEILKVSGGSNEVKNMIANLHSDSELTFTGRRSDSPAGSGFISQNINATITNNGKDATVTWDLPSPSNTGKKGSWGVFLTASGTSEFVISGMLPYIMQEPKIEIEIRDTINGWNKSTKAQLNITEVYSSNADLSLICDGKEILTKKYTVQNDAISDEIELAGLGIKAGSKLEWVVTLPGGTEARTEMDMTNIDVTGPILNTDLEEQADGQKQEI